MLDVDVPSMLLDQCAIRDELEMTKMRYTAVTCDPNDFVVCLESSLSQSELMDRMTSILLDNGCMTRRDRQNCLL